MMSLVRRILVVAGMLATVWSAAAGNDSPGTVYTMTNAVPNRVLSFARNAHGEITPAGDHLTGGSGTGAGLGSQGALALTDDGRWLLAVNAGSNELSVFAVRHDSLVLTDIVPSGGLRPISVTVAANLVYVLNAGAGENITGFFLTEKGRLHPVPGSTQPLSGANVAPAQVSFGLRGDVLIVTEKATSRIDGFPVDDAGRAGPVVSTPSSGAVPFGFAITSRGVLLVSEAVVSALSSYDIHASGAVDVITPSLPNFQAAACWVALSKNERYAYTANAAGNSISGYHVDKDGTLTLFNDGGFTAAANRPLDLAVSNNGRFLYALNAGSGAITGYAIKSDGTLTGITSAGGLPPGSAGLVAR